MKLLIIFIVFIIFSTNVLSQDFGEFEDSLLTTTSFKHITDDNAVIIFDKTYYKITRHFELEATRHKRLKILTDKGSENANVEFYYWHKDELNFLEAICMNPDGEEFELDDENIFIEEQGKHYKVSFAVPGVIKGSVIDIQYGLFSESVSWIEPWNFQSSIYTLNSEFSISMPKGFVYNVLFRNTENYDFSKDEVISFDPDDPSRRIAIFYWVCKNVPGIKELPFMNNVDDHYAKMHVVLKSFKNQFNDITLSETWDNIAENKYKYVLQNYLYVDDLTEDFVENRISAESSDLEKAKLIYQFISDSIVTSDTRQALTNDLLKPDEVMQEGVGNRTEKNLLAVNLFNHAGIKAYPLLVSSKANGKVDENYCDISQFNRLIVVSEIMNKAYFFDTAESELPFGTLPYYLDVGLGLMLDETKGSMISVKPKRYTNSLDINTKVEFLSTDTLLAKTKFQFQGHYAYKVRNDIKKNGIEKVVEEILDGIGEECRIDSFQFDNVKELIKPVILRVYYNINCDLDISDEFVYMPINMFTNIDENPFKEESRTFDIDFPYKKFTYETLEITIPEGFYVEEHPESKFLSASDLRYSKTYQGSNSTFKCTRNESRNTTAVNYTQYEKIKKIYNDMILTDEEMIVLKNKSVSEEG